MAKILLDDDFFNMEGDENDETYIKKVIDFLLKYFNVDFAFFQDENCSYRKYNIFSHNAVIKQRIQKTGRFVVYENIIKRSDDNYCELSFSESFIGKIDEIHRDGEEVIIPVCTSKHRLDKKCINGYVYIINHIYQELDSNFAKFILENKYINTGSIERPSLRKPLPNMTLCNCYKNVQDKETKGRAENEKKTIYLKIGEEVVQRNAYKYDSKISSMNGSGEKMRKIYKSGEGRKIIYASIDFEHGALEICNASGEHVDEFTYIGEPQNRKNQNHSIKVP